MIKWSNNLNFSKICIEILQQNWVSMMNNKVDQSYQKDHDSFMEKLRECHQARGFVSFLFIHCKIYHVWYLDHKESLLIYFFSTSFGRIPTFGGQSLDLFALYNTVTSFGGISVVKNCYPFFSIHCVLYYCSFFSFLCLTFCFLYVLCISMFCFSVFLWCR